MVEPVISVFNSRDINVTQNMINYKCTLPNSKLFTGLSYSSYAGTKTISDKASVHTRER